ncbi:hypothetical protein M0R45_028065 [Rubus argutus]|uniref:Uncharacterized protein n=1 Tax=Rubus argutus TaxID=59490 RepID=A0AAW1W630_RUBAR
MCIVAQSSTCVCDQFLCDRFVQQKLGGPSLSEYEKLQAELSELQMKYNQLFAAYQETRAELEGLKSSQSHMTHNEAPGSTKETIAEEAQKEKV